jgi:NAD(P)-dependent dehydrogenase (short-subunit alcohol dehydrogenase family)
MAERRVALVTGAGSGIGRAAVLAFARRGDACVVADLDEPAGRETVARVEQAGGEATFVKTDVASDGDVRAMVAHALERFGRLDWAFNNAGITTPPRRTAELDEADWDRVIAVDLKGVWLCLRHEIPAILSSDAPGAIVNMSSMWGLVGFHNSTAAYVASKHGVLGLTRAAALEYATDGLRVNAVCPGVIHTPGLEARLAREPEHERTLAAWAPVERLGTPDEVAEAVVWLCSDAAQFITGQALSVDGGYTAR